MNPAEVQQPAAITDVTIPIVVRGGRKGGGTRKRSVVVVLITTTTPATAATITIAECWRAPTFPFRTAPSFRPSFLLSASILQVCIVVVLLLIAVAVAMATEVVVVVVVCVVAVLELSEGADGRGGKVSVVEVVRECGRVREPTQGEVEDASDAGDVLRRDAGAAAAGQG